MFALERVIENNDWITLILLGLGVLLVFVKFLDAERFRSLWLLPFNSYYFTQFEGKTNQISKGFYLLLFLVSNIVLSLVIYIGIKHWKLNYTFQFENLYLKIIAVQMGYWLFRFFVGKFIAWVLDFSSIHQEIVFVKLSYFISIHLYVFILLIPALFFFKNHDAYYYFAGVLYFILLIIRYIKTIVMFNKWVTTHIFYFILYLCALEIAPLLLIYKWCL